MTDTIIVLQNEREEAGTMILKEKERTTIEDLQTQEKSCIEKYGRYAQQAKDPELKNLFQTLQQKEREHYDSLDRVLRGEVLSVTATTVTDEIISQKQPTRQ